MAPRSRDWMTGPNVLRAIDARHNPSQDTMNRLLKPFRLKLSLARIDEMRRRQGDPAAIEK